MKPTSDPHAPALTSRDASPALAPASDVVPASTALLVREVAGERARYAMVELVALSPDGATLAGLLLLERDEALTLEVSVDDGEPLCVHGRVVRLLRDLPGMEVAFSGLDETQRKRIARRATSAA